MFVARSRGVKLAPLGEPDRPAGLLLVPLNLLKHRDLRRQPRCGSLAAACPPNPPTRAGFMPLLAELENYVVGRLGYKHSAPDGAFAPAHAYQVSRPDADFISL